MNFLSIPLKKSASVDLSSQFQQLIALQYGALTANACVGSLSELALMRTVACVKGDNYNPTVEAIASYHDAMYQLEGRLNVNIASRIDFKWSDISGKSNKKESSLKFERSNVLFCYGAAHSQLGESCRPNCENSLQQALKSFKIASCTFDYISSDLMSGVKDPLPDLTPSSLTLFSNLMLAQAYECVLSKAEKDKKKPGILARIASTLTNLYEDCLSECSGGAKNVVPKDWSGVLSMKKGLYEALTQYHQSKACCEAKQYGEQVARISFAYELIKGVARSSCFQRKNLVEQFKQEESVAVKDNDHIYHEKVPPRGSLAPVESVDVIKKTPLTFPLSSSNTKDYFENLLPMAVTEAVNTAKGVRASLIDSEICRLRGASTKVNEVLASYNLPAALLANGLSSITSNILSKASSVRRDGGAEKLYQQLLSIPECVQRNKEIIEAEKSSLDDEENSDNSLRKQYGERWSRKPSSELNKLWRSDIQKCLNLLEQTTKTDASLLDRYEKHKEHFEILSKPEDELQALIESDSKFPESGTEANNEELKSELTQLCNKLESIKTERNDLIEQLKLVDYSPDLVKKLLTYYREHNETIDLQIATDMLEEKMVSVRELIQENLNKQESLLNDLQTKADMFYGASDGNSKDKGLLTMLNLAADEYSALTEAVRDATKFYAELTEICVNTQCKIEDFCAARTTEKNELMSDIATNISRVLPTRPEPSYANRVNPVPPAHPQVPMPIPTIPMMNNNTYPMPPQPWNPQGYPVMPQPSPFGMAPYPAMYPFYGAYPTMPMPPNASFSSPNMMHPAHSMGANGAFPNVSGGITDPPAPAAGGGLQGQYLPGQPSAQP
ncbi:putative programmed cell death 6-interacting protein [Schistosoma mansoni]|uniref:putative programmed cell death 6-interacting protein n=1 Tax=Schistosoma mansoni TaxID=6183 RepID=UPI00022DBF94|nr:putative programmed cell death 6-interacting protein [Schistosoma mansoni]|eukprot:XP_018651223.1 putative programmed cell death 6-interacting protein [Schistosoma mansoni]